MLKIINDKEFLKLAETGKPIVLTFYADWCGPCKMQHPILEQLANDDKYKDIEFVKINVEGSTVAAGMGVMSIPAISFFNDGEEVNRVMGFHPAPQLEQVIDSTFK